MWGSNNAIFFQLDNEFIFFWYLLLLILIPAVSLLHFHICYWQVHFDLLRFGNIMSYEETNFVFRDINCLIIKGISLVWDLQNPSVNIMPLQPTDLHRPLLMIKTHYQIDMKMPLTSLTGCIAANNQQNQEQVTLHSSTLHY